MAMKTMTARLVLYVFIIWCWLILLTVSHIKSHAQCRLTYEAETRRTGDIRQPATSRQICGHNRRCLQRFVRCHLPKSPYFTSNLPAMNNNTMNRIRNPMAPTLRSCQNPGRTVTPFSWPPSGPDCTATGVPQPGHDAAFDDISLPHSGHFIIAIYFPLFWFDSLTFLNEIVQSQTRPRRAKISQCHNRRQSLGSLHHRNGHHCFFRKGKPEEIFGEEETVGVDDNFGELITSNPESIVRSSVSSASAVWCLAFCLRSSSLMSLSPSLRSSLSSLSSPSILAVIFIIKSKRVALTPNEKS